MLVLFIGYIYALKKGRFRLETMTRRQMAPPLIQFGTAGWRALMARDFTFANVRLASQAVAEYLKAALADPASGIQGRDPRILLAYDCRFLGRQFALASAEVFAANGLTPLVCQRDTPTPVLSFAIRRRKAIGGINITASHNPPGILRLQILQARWRGRAARSHPADRTNPSPGSSGKTGASPPPLSGPFSCGSLDPQAEYFRQIRKLADFSAIKKARLKVAVDLMHGCGRGYLDTLLREAGARLTVLHGDLNPLFGGHRPNRAPRTWANAETGPRRPRRLGLATDGDADRFGVVDSDGTWITPNQVLALTLYHLAKHRGWKGSAVRTVVTSHQVDAVAAQFGVQVHEVPVGFKYIGAIMEREPVIVGGEESGGLSVRGHVPEKTASWPVC
jgi:phosphoglucomutase